MADRDRKAELERKRAKLNALREEKERKKKEKEQQLAAAAGVDATASLSSGGVGPSSLEDVDTLLSNLNIEGVSMTLSKLNTSSEDPSSILTTPDSSLAASGAVAGSGGKLTPAAKAEDQAKRREKLTVSQVTQTNIPSQEKVTYTKETQTAQTGGSNQRDPLAFDYYVLAFDDTGEGDGEESSLSMDRPSKLPPGILPHGFPQVVDVQPAVTASEQAAKQEEEQKAYKPKDLSEDEKQMIIMSPDFQKFMDKSTRILERALCEQSVDIFVDYAKTADADEGNEEKSATRLSLNRVFYDEKWSKNRCVTALDWSTQYPELLAASYSNNEDSPHDPDGVCLIWNTKFMKPSPEYVFHCQSPVTSTAFAKFHPNLVLGGTYSGSIVLWDNRVEKKTPVQRSPLTASAHTHPIYCLKVVGAQNSHNVISISTDGKLCTWSLDMLAVPQEILDLQHKQNKTVAATCLAFPHGSVNNFMVGSEEGTVYSACRHGTKTGILDAYEGHFAPVTGISPHSVPGPIDFSHLYLTSSFDWSVKLWSVKEPRPIYSFEVTGDYIYDVAWSPIHPSVFADVDGHGRLNLWNLNHDTELPSATVQIDGPAALNRVSWTHSGLHVTAGDDMGKIWVYDVGEQLANPKSDDWSKFAKTLAELKSNQTGDDIIELNPMSFR